MICLETGYLLWLTVINHCNGVSHGDRLLLSGILVITLSYLLTTIGPPTINHVCMPPFWIHATDPSRL